MSRRARAIVIGCATLAVVLAVSTMWMASALGGAASLPSHPTVGTDWKTLPGETLVSAPPPGDSQPDDIAWLPAGNLDGGKTLVWTEFQNGINPNGTPSSQYGPTQSVIAGFDPQTGVLVRAISVWGHVDGVTGDAATGMLLVTTNEDANSAFYLINPASGAVTTYSYTPSPTVNGNGGTDSIVVIGGQYYISHSNPNDLTQPAAYLMTLHETAPYLTAELQPVFYCDSTALDANTGQMITMALTDPDTNYLMPGSSPLYGGDFATISQGDGRIIFASHLGGIPQLTQLNLTDNVSGNLPPIDGLAVTTANGGTLYASDPGADGGAGTIMAFSTAGYPAGTVFVTEPADNGNPLIGILDLSSGVITPFANHLIDPKGLIYVAPDGVESGE
jgi:hypothetical protein